ncbi:MAG: hypothetical protein K2P18_01345 [Oscillospiraceae bacterium]|nr:hypothetical protein [Oscillospiraceae bacterium]
MKFKQNKIASLVIALSLLVCMYTLPMPAQANAPETPMITGSLANPGDTATYDLEIDHALYPEVILHGFAYGEGTGNAIIRVYDEDGTRITGISLMNTLNDKIANTVTSPKGSARIKSSSAITKNYRITVETETGDVSYAMNVGTMDTYAKDCAGPNNVTTVAKNIPPEAAYIKTVYFGRPQMLLNDGEWFRYKADGYTYITARIPQHDTLAFDVYDAVDNSLVYRTTAEDRGTKVQSTSLYTGYVQKGLELENGKDYLIKFYSTSHIATTNLSDHYYISIGYPFLTTQKFRYTAHKYYVPANTTKIIYINVTDPAIPKSARLGGNSAVHFTTDSSLNDAYITSCKMTAPNGFTFTLLNGSKRGGFVQPSPVNYLSDINHVPVHGTWKVTIRTSKSLNLEFYFTGYYDIIMGKDGN